jgi:enamine deaminase RidA (YjgF/YER057c/UK114 family)
MGSKRIMRHNSPVTPGISQCVRVSAGDLLFVSGAVGFESDGSVPEDFGRAVELALRGLERALTTGGATFSDLVSMNVFVVDLDQEKIGVFRRVRDGIIDTDSAPASSLIGVCSLYTALFKGATVEIDAIAAV